MPSSGQRRYRRDRKADAAGGNNRQDVKTAEKWRVPAPGDTERRQAPSRDSRMMQILHSKRRSGRLRSSVVSSLQPKTRNPESKIAGATVRGRDAYAT